MVLYPLPREEVSGTELAAVLMWAKRALMVGEDIMLFEMFTVLEILDVVVGFCSLVTGAMKRAKAT